MGQTTLVHLDSMVFIYYLDSTDKKLHEASRRIIHQVVEGEISAITSQISVIETLSPAKYTNDPDRMEAYTLFFRNTPNLTVYPVDWNVSLEAANLRRRFRWLRTPDAIQLSTAIVGGVKRFITSDIRLKKIANLPFELALLK